MEQLRLKGEYTFDITYNRMFDTYKASFHHHNLITDKGLEFLISKWAEDYKTENHKRTRYNISKIIVGSNPEDPKPEDTINTFTTVETGQNPFNINVYSDGTSLKMSTNNLSGRTLNGTTEIGVIGELLEEELDESTGEPVNRKLMDTILISRDTHPVIIVPLTCIISLEYIYTLTSINIDECEEE